MTSEAVRDRRGDVEFAARLDGLIGEWELSHGHQLQYRHLVEALAREGQAASASYMSMLRRGHRSRPRPELIEALAGFFGADPHWLRTGTARGERRADVSVIATVSHYPLRRLLLAATGLSSPSLSMLAELAERIRPGDAELPGLRYTARLTDSS
ncbi:hypothetical protein [Nocardia bovistercoris]|uniref:HTH cro/C1-type domain-containing protein n=1 Tax=Nocardia bovistercoris TaxID=2785916 RepID=A0A931IEI0_9NOCA|nr:hypothetical protein [Nocardia bovistercoris]MBH0780222.1 hypothetical protein [Nocardia bovistercoris]